MHIAAQARALVNRECCVGVPEYAIKEVAKRTRFKDQSESLGLPSWVRRGDSKGIANVIRRCSNVTASRRLAPQGKGGEANALRLPCRYRARGLLSLRLGKSRHATACA
ncbi:hypothetical protein K431DRAFT_288914 [Polychaeton citri CBS 116435]|uniref:Uncharacterized protein n=1 Tax=Polychaeton citri CBS 116435 TaxID=1314669 RepID=A0A9P4UK37_9PEZI|nr:hypothetical protein K431DRAFT_288914 [Polychaeton citri CBS 116435]